MDYLCSVFLLPAGAPVEVEEALIAELWMAGTLGVEYDGAVEGRVRLRAYFPYREGTVAMMPAAENGVESLGEEVVAERDWLAVYREGAQPFAVGRTFFVDPRDMPGEPPVAVPAGRTLLRVPARAAFGIGSHESTALAIELMEELDLRGARVLDVGAGTGILAFAALSRGAMLAVGLDADLAAPFHARDNGNRNRLPIRLFAGRLSALAVARPPQQFELAVVNVVPEQILPELPALVALLAPAGGAIWSGILAERGDEALAAAGALGLAEAARRRSGEWVAFRLTRAGGAAAGAGGS
jgi:ribosomal protein L11 methyltransferase